MIKFFKSVIEAYLRGEEIEAEFEFSVWDLLLGLILYSMLLYWVIKVFNL
jgi:hypothetical protein